MQYARLTGRGTAGRTGHDGYLFGGEFFLFHSDRMRKYRARNSSILHTIRVSRYLSEASESCPLLHRFLGPSLGSIDMESEQGNELRVLKANEVSPTECTALRYRRGLI
jgi:hypothetical protein